MNAGGVGDKADPHRFFATQGVVYVLSSLVQRLAVFVLVPVYATVLLPSEYGKLGLVTASAQMVGAVFGLGLSPALVRAYYEQGGRAGQIAIASTVFVLLGLSALLLLAGAWFGSDMLAWRVLGDRSSGAYFVMAAASVACGLLGQVAYTLFRVQGRAITYAVYQTGGLFFEITLVLILVGVAGLGVAGALAGRLAAAGLLALLLVAAVKDHLAFRFLRPEVARLLAYGAPLMVSGVLGWIVTYSDRFFVAHYHGVDAAGVYTLGQQLGMLVVAFLVNPLKLVWDQAFLAIEKEQALAAFCSRALTHVTLVGAAVFLAVSLLAGNIVKLVARPDYAHAYPLVPIIAGAYLLWAARVVTEAGLIRRRKTLAAAGVSLLGAALSLGLNWALVPPFGAQGAAFATLLTFAVMLAVDGAYNQRLLRVRYEWQRLGVLAAVTGLLLAIGTLVQPDGTLASLGFDAALVLALPVVLVLSGFFRPDEKALAAAILQQLLLRWLPARRNIPRQ